jgi:hypothetical protein
VISTDHECSCRTQHPKTIARVDTRNAGSEEFDRACKRFDDILEKMRHLPTKRFVNVLACVWLVALFAATAAIHITVLHIVAERDAAAAVGASRRK